MPHDVSRLAELLADLQRQLADSSTIDPATRDRLQATLAEAQRAVVSDQARSGKLSERLSSLAIDFEAAHPALGGTLTSAIDALAQMGI